MLLGEGNDDVFERLASAVGLSDRQYPLPEVFWSARKLVEILSARRPLVLVLEDLHWAEPALLDLVDHVAETADDAPALLLCVARPEVLEARPAWEKLDHLALTPLSAAASAQIVDNFLGDNGIADDARTRIVEAADGNPLFVEQLLSMMIDDGLLLLEDGVWCTGELQPDWVPPSIHALLTARLDALEREQRAVIDPASVIGHYFQQPALEELVDDFVRDQVGTRLGELEGKQFVRHDADTLHRFHHVLIRDSVYDGLLKRARATLHERFVAVGRPRQRRPRRRVRRDLRLPPRAGAPVSDRARGPGRARHRSRPRGLEEACVGRPASLRARRHECRGQSPASRNLAAAAAGSADGSLSSPTSARR